MKLHRSLALLLVLLFGAAALAIPTPAAQAQIAGVVRYVAQPPRGNASCDSWANACDLQDALAKAAAGDKVWVAAGVYRPATTDPNPRKATFQLKNSVEIYGGFAFGESDFDNRDWVANETILSGDIGEEGVAGDNVYHVVTGSGTDGTAALDGFTITGGYADGTFLDSGGGGMLNDNGSPTLTNVTFSGNTGGEGGGMLNEDSNPTLENVTFSGNTATWGSGMANLGSSPTLTNVTFSGNTAGDGGGMYNIADSNPELTNVTFSGNTATWGGGGMFNDMLSGPTLKNVTFSGNTTTFYGGGMFNVSDSSPTINNAIFWGNTADTGGPQVFNLSSTSTLTNSVVQADNQYTPGGCPSYSQCTNIRTEDPLLGPLGNWGGATQTIPLLPGSPAIDAVTDGSCPSTDQRGVERPAGSCDFGAFEARFTLEIESGDNQSALINTAFDAPLVVRVRGDYGEPVDGGLVAFHAPDSGPSAVPQERMVTIKDGLASLPVAANEVPGSYTVSASAAGAASTVRFHLANNPRACYLPLVAAGMQP